MSSSHFSKSGVVTFYIIDLDLEKLITKIHIKNVGDVVAWVR
jgi:hypothetical protein